MTETGTAPDDRRTMYTVDSLAAKWGMSPRFIRGEIECGALRAYKFGRAVRIHPDDVDGYEGSHVMEV